VVAACGCGGAGDVGPMSGRQLLAGRDFGNLFFWNGRTLEFTRNAAEQPSTGPQDLWAWPLDQAAPALALTGIDWSQYEPMPRWFMGELLATGWQLERLYDVTTGQSEDLFAHFSGTPPDAASAAGTGGLGGDVYRLTAMRSDGGAIARVRWDTNAEIVVGRPGDLRTFAMPGGGSIGGIAFLGADLAVLRARAGTGLVAMIGIDRLDTSTGAVTPLVEATPAGEWSGYAGWCDTARTLVCGAFGTIACTMDEPPCEDGRQPCSIYFVKADPDDAAKNAVYLYDVGRATTTRMVGDNPDAVFATPGTRSLVWGNQPSTFTRHRNICSGTEWACGFSPGRDIAWRPDLGGFATYGRANWLSIADVAGERCIQPTSQAASNADRAAYGPGGDRLMWVADDLFAASQTMWLGDGEGESPIAVAHGSFLLGGFSSDGRILHATHFETSTTALGWVDVAAVPMTENILSSNTGGAFRDNRRALFIDHFNSQDGYGDLVLVELATGATQLLARSVTEVAVEGNVDEATEVAYAVKGRASSARDGLWLMTLPP